MDYSMALLLEKSGLDQCRYISYESKKGRTYSGLILWDKDIFPALEHPVFRVPAGCFLICLATVNEFMSWSVAEVQALTERFALILIDTDDSWDVQKMQYSESILHVENDLIVLREMSLAKGFNKLESVFRSLDEMMKTFSDAVINHSNLQQMIELFFDYMGNPAYIVDSSFKVLAVDRRNDMRELSAVWRRLEDQGYLQYNIVTDMIKDQELSEMESNEGASWVQSAHFNTPFINYNLRRKHKLIGHLFVVNMFKKITAGDIELCNKIGKLIERSMADNPRYQMERGRLYEYFMSDIFSGRIRDLNEIREQMAPLQYREDSFYQIALIKSQEENLSEFSEERLFYLIERLQSCKPTHYEDKIAVLLPVSSPEECRNLCNTLKNLAENARLTIGLSECFYGYSYIHTGMKQAYTAYSKAVQRRLQLTCFGDIVLESMSSSVSSVTNLDMFEPPCLGILREYDQKNNTNLLETLRVFLKHERNVIETSKAMFIHRNTLTYRIHKIEEITGTKFSDPALRLRILLFLEICQ